MTEYISDNSEPAISAVIPAYNAAGTIERAIDSIYAQTYDGPLEIILVDDGSTDGTADVVRRRYPAVQIVQQPNRGLAGARNAGVRAATHDLVAFLDSDDRWAPGKIEAQVEVFDQLPRDSVLFTMSTIVAGRDVGTAQKTALLKRRIAQAISRQRQSITELLPTTIMTRGVCGASLMLSRDAYVRAGGYDESIRVSEDYPFFLKLLAEGSRLYLLNQPLYVAYVRPDSLHRSAEAGGSVARIEAFEAFDPHHSVSGRRLFSQEDFDNAFQIRLLIESIAHIEHGLVAEGRNIILSALSRGDFDPVRTYALRAGLRDPVHLRFFVWLLRRLGLLRL